MLELLPYAAEIHHYFDLDRYRIRDLVHKDIERILYTEDEIRARVQELGRIISDDYIDVIGPDSEFIAVCLLRGSAIFTADLVREIDLPIELDFMVVSSYGDEAKSSGIIDIQKDLCSDIDGKHVLVIEDIIDSGLTLSHLIEVLARRNPASLNVASLLKKTIDGQRDIDCRYIGFECPDEFIVGYGLDYAQSYRNLPYIGTLKREIYE